jgi:hypothetical protein
MVKSHLASARTSLWQIPIFICCHKKNLTTCRIYFFDEESHNMTAHKHQPQTSTRKRSFQKQSSNPIEPTPPWISENKQQGKFVLGVRIGPQNNKGRTIGIDGLVLNEVQIRLCVCASYVSSLCQACYSYCTSSVFLCGAFFNWWSAL